MNITPKKFHSESVVSVALFKLQKRSIKTQCTRWYWDWQRFEVYVSDVLCWLQKTWNLSLLTQQYKTRNTFSPKQYSQPVPWPCQTEHCCNIFHCYLIATELSRRAFVNYEICTLRLAVANRTNQTKYTPSFSSIVIDRCFFWRHKNHMYNSNSVRSGSLTQMRWDEGNSTSLPNNHTQNKLYE